MVVVKFANGKEFKADSIDDAIKQCLASGHDPFKPTVVDVFIEEVVEVEKVIEVKSKSRAKK